MKPKSRLTQLQEQFTNIYQTKAGPYFDRLSQTEKTALFNSEFLSFKSLQKARAAEANLIQRMLLKDSVVDLGNMRYYEILDYTLKATIFDWVLKTISASLLTDCDFDEQAKILAYNTPNTIGASKQTVEEIASNRLEIFENQLFLSSLTPDK